MEGLAQSSAPPLRQRFALPPPRAELGEDQTRPLEQRPRKQRPLHLLEQLAVELLPAEPGPAIGLDHPAPEVLADMDVLAGRPAGLDGPVERPHPPDDRHRARGRRHHDPRPFPEPHPHHQIVPGEVRLPPLGDLVAPREMVLRTPQLVAGRSRIDERLRSAREAQDPARRDPAHLLAGCLRDRDQPARPLDHDPGDLSAARPDQGDLRPLHLPCPGRHPLRPGQRLAEPAPRHQQPHPPIAAGASGRRLPLPAMGLPEEFPAKPPQHRPRHPLDQPKPTLVIRSARLPHPPKQSPEVRFLICHGSPIDFSRGDSEAPELPVPQAEKKRGQAAPLSPRPRASARTLKPSGSPPPPPPLPSSRAPRTPSAP